MMAGITDVLTDIRTTGQGVPMGAPQPPQSPMMGGQPPQPPMGAPQPPMPQPPMPEPGMGEMAMQGQEPPAEEPAMSIEQDSAALAQAVVGRTQGDIGAAVAVLDNAKALLIASTEQQEPQMMNGGGALRTVPEGKKGAGLRALSKAVRNKIGFKNMGGPLYREGGGSMSDSDVLRQMIMENLQQPSAQEQVMQVAKVVGQAMQPTKQDAMADLMKYRMS